MSLQSEMEALRLAAGDWSLAGDRRLLDLLQNLHKSILSKCQDTNQRLEEMTTSLNEACVSLQNVNNRFISLSNTQFVENRVYDDDSELIDDGDKKPAPVESSNQMSVEMLRESLRILEDRHSPVEIINDSDDEDEEPSIVLRPKNLYGDRPLPYIIGSQHWKNKWHAGLIAEESDSDSQSLKHDKNDDFSDSDTESDRQTDKHLQDNYQDSTPSSLKSDIINPIPAKGQLSQSDIAAELARRLGGMAKMPEPIQPENDVSVKPVIPTAFITSKPPVATVFPEEPPPILPQEEPSDSEEDIFAEINKNVPYSNRQKVGNAGIFEDMNDQDVFGSRFTASNRKNIPENPPKSEQVITEPTLDEVKSKLDESKEISRKPIGGISLFGSNKGAESIGAAILKRNKRVSDSSDDGDEESSPANKSVPNANNSVIHKHLPTDVIKEITNKNNKSKTNTAAAEVDKNDKKDVLKELFSNTESKPVVASEVKTKKVDIFSDDIFDDVDDIFASNVVVAKTVNTDSSKTKKSLFDDVDDLFADLGVKTTSDGEAQNKKVTSVFDSDDELFSEKATQKTPETNTTEKPVTNNVNKNTIDSEVEKDISKLLVNTKNAQNDISLDSDSELFSDKPQKVVNPIKSKLSAEIDTKSVSLFDSDDDDIFSKIQAPSKISTEDGPNKTNIERPIQEALTNDSNLTEKGILDINSIEVENKTMNPQENTPQNIMIQDKEESPLKYPIEEDKKKSKTAVFGDTEQIDDIFGKTEIKESTNIDKNPKIDNEPINENLFDDNMPVTVTDKNTFDTKTTADNEETVTQNDDKIPDIFEDNVEVQTENISEPIDFPADKTSVKSSLFDEIDEIEPITSNQIPEQITNDIPKLNKVENKDIFDLFNDEPPPVFEDKKDVNKPRNVNALFEDDSDDETLFFKKSSNLTDVKPNEISKTNESLFSIFRDEPPDLDTDFLSEQSQKVTSKIDSMFSDTEIESPCSNFNAKTDITDNMFDPLPKETSVPKKDENIFNKTDKTNILKQEVESIKTIDDSEKIAKETSINETTDKPDGIPQTKTVGKLKAVNLNINVNTLLPGASPKKLNKIVAETEPEPKPSLVKSVSFDSDPDSLILDNKISKERAKIKVKRRPSTRRARIEAVRKSAIDFGDDVDGDDNNDSSDKTDSHEKSDALSKISDVTTDSSVMIEKSVENDANTELFNKKTEIYDKANEKSVFDVKTEILNINEHDTYILKQNTIIAETKSAKNINEGISTLGKVYKETSPSQNTDKAIRNSIFDDDDDEDLFQSSAKKDIATKVIDQKHTELKSDSKLIKRSLFDDSSDDEDLFAKNDLFKKKSDVFTRNIEKQTKKSLFDDDEIDMFCPAKTEEQKPKESKPTAVKEEATSSKIVLDDPLSMLGNDEDE